LGQARQTHTITRAETDLRAATRNREILVQKVAQSKALAERERNKVREWAAATRNTADKRDSLTNAINDLDAALAVTRPERVIAAATDPTNELGRSIGPPPATRGGRAAWWGIAERVETDRDHGLNLGTRHVTDGVGTVLGHALEIIPEDERTDSCHSARIAQRSLGRRVRDPQLWLS